MTALPATAPSMLHGGRLEAARRAWPDAPTPWLDLSTGINPIPYPIPTLPPESFTRLPEPEAVARLEALAATAYGVTDPAMVVAAPGTQILIDLLPRLRPPTAVAVLSPTYGEHHAAWARAGHSVTAVPNLTDHPVLILCNPNNPDGRTHRPADLLDNARRCDLLVVDEAFADFAPAELSLAPHLTPAHDNIVILRSFGKTYGLAGIRLGFAIAAPPRAAAIRAALGAWAVSGPALAIGRIALADPLWRAEAQHRLANDAAALDQILTSAGMAMIGGTTLFRLATAPDAACRFEHLARAGILVRRFDAAPTWLRFGIPSSEHDRARLGAALSRPIP